MTDQPIVLLVSGEYPPYSAWGGNAYQMGSLARLLNGQGFQVEVIAESDDGHEFTHLDERGNLVHRVAAAQSYLMKPLRAAARRAGQDADQLKDVAYALRVAEKAYEIAHVWGRRILWAETTNWRAESFFLHLVPSLNRRVLVRIVTPLEEVVRQNSLSRTLPIRVTLAQEMVQQVLVRERLYSNREYRDYFRDLVRTRAPLVPPGRDHTFLLPFDFARVRRRAPGPASAEGAPARLLMIGRVEQRKGFDVVCAALAALSPGERRRIRVVAVGRDVGLASGRTYRAELEERYPEIVRECFEFLGQVPDAELQRHVDAADAGLVASTSESFGYNLVELLASDLPVVTSDVGAASELERRGVRYAGKFDTPAQLAEILRTLPSRLQVLAGGPSNRGALEAMYRDNDAAYLDHVLSRVVRPGDRPTAHSRRYGPGPKVRSLDVVVCSSGRVELLERTLRGVLEEVKDARAAGLDVSVRVTAPGDDIGWKVREWHPEENLTFRLVGAGAAGRNEALTSLAGDAVLFLEEGAVPAPGLLLAHARALDSPAQPAAVAGRVNARGEPPSKARHVGQARLSGALDWNHGSDERGAPLVPLFASAANASFHRARMDALLGPGRWFDERFDKVPGGREVALGAALRRAGGLMLYAPDAAVSRDAPEAATHEAPEPLLREVFGPSRAAVATALAMRRAKEFRTSRPASSEVPSGGVMSKVRKLQRMLYRVPGVGYLAESLVAFSTLPRKFRDLNERLLRVEHRTPSVISIPAAPAPAATSATPAVSTPPPSPDSVVAMHIPAILNYVTSFAHTSRELTRRLDELERRMESTNPPGGEPGPSTKRLRAATRR